MSVVVICGKIGCVAAVFEDSDLIWECLMLDVCLYVCVRDVMEVVFSVYIVTLGAIGVSVWEV